MIDESVINTPKEIIPVERPAPVDLDFSRGKIHDADVQAIEEAVLAKIRQFADSNMRTELSASQARDIGRELIIARVAANIKPVIQALLDAATGEYRLEINKNTGQIRRYRERPNVAAATFLINQLIGKPIEQVEVQQRTTVVVDI